MKYEIIINGQIGEKWRSMFEDIEIKQLPNGKTRLFADFEDQSEFYGTISKIRDLGLSLYKVVDKSC